MENKVLFEEVQQFRQWWIYAIFALCIAAIVYAVLQNKSDTSLWIQIAVAIPLIAVFVLMRLLKLELRITNNYIEYSFYPLIKQKRIDWKDVEFAQMVTYHPLVGYGIRFTFSYGRMYNVSGENALLIQPKVGKKFSIGTQNPDELDAALEQVFKAKRSGK